MIFEPFYNFYNIGAYQDNYTSSAVTRGIAVAAGLVDSYEGTPWDTREKAIVYGGKFIATAYINNNQNTLYYQKPIHHIVSMTLMTSF